MAANTFTDSYGNNNSEADQFNWIYDITAPVIVISPANGTVGVSLKSNITLTFSEAIRNLDNSDLTDTNVDGLIRLKTPNHSGTDIAFDATIDTDKKVITIDPTNNFSFSQTIYVSIDQTLEDMANNAILSAAASFATADTNRAPVLYTIGNKTTFEDVAMNIVLSATDADDDAITFTGLSSDANVTVTIADSLLTFRSTLNWHGSSNITITATDDGPSNLTDAETFTLTVQPVNDAPTILALSPDSVKENLSVNTYVGIFTATDVDTGETFSYSFISGDGRNDADNNRFTISNDSLYTTAIFDYEVKDTLMIRVQVRDFGSLTLDANTFVYVINEPEPEIAVSPDSLIFGEVITNHTSQKMLTVTSTGLDTTVIDSVVVSGSGYSIDLKTYPISLAQNQSTDFNFTFSPIDSGKAVGQAAIYSNNDSGIKLIRLVGMGINDTIPPVITNLSIPITSPANQDITISVPVTDENKITDVTLYYRVGGDQKTYNTVATDNKDGTYSGVIEKGKVSINGLVYYYSAKDEYDNLKVGDTLSASIQYEKDLLTSAVNGSAYPTGIPKDKWRLISIPTHLDVNSIGETVGDELEKSSSDQSWLIYEDKGDANWADATEIKIGNGYWVHQRITDDMLFSVGSGASVDLRSHTIRIPSGWSLIGNPYPFEIKVSFDPASIYGPLTYGKKGTEGWDSESNVMLPWEGYAVYNRTDDSLNLDIFPLDGLDAPQEVNETDGWQINISAHNGEFGDRHNAIGRRTSGSEEFDQWDNPEPPKLDQYISLAMDRTDWGVETSLTSDIRSMNETDGQWNLHLNTKGIRSSIKLDTKFKGDFPLYTSAVMFDPVERKTYNLLDEVTIEINRINDHYNYPLTILVGSPDYVVAKTEELISQLPESFSLGQNYPNPFNPVTNIPFTVAVPAHVQISIYNLLGQKVTTLENRWFDMGKFHTSWNGKDANGNTLSTGMYIYSLESKEFRQAKKLVLLK